MQLWLQALSSVLIPQFLGLDVFFPSDHLENSDFSAAARIVPPPNHLDYHKYDTQTTQKGYPRGVQFYLGRSLVLLPSVLVLSLLPTHHIPLGVTGIHRFLRL